jgi:hypothetical protein
MDHVWITIQSFKKLSKQLNENERQQLLDKLTRDGEGDSTSYNGENDSKERQYRHARVIYEKLGFFDKFIIWIVSFFSGKKREDVVIQEELQKIQRDVKSRYPNLVSFESKRFTHNFARELVKLSRAIEIAGKSAGPFYTRGNYFLYFLVDLFESLLPTNLQELLSYCDPDNLDQNNDYLDKNQYNQEKNRRIKRFFNQVDLIMNEEFNTGLKNFELMIKLLNFEFYPLMKDFSLNSHEESVSARNFSEFFKCQKQVEQLFRLLKEITFEPSAIPFADSLARYSATHPLGDDEAGNKIVYGDQQNQLLATVIETVHDMKKRIPFKEVFQCIHEDLLYKVQPIAGGQAFMVQYKEYKRKFF